MEPILSNSINLRSKMTKQSKIYYIQTLSTEILMGRRASSEVFPCNVFLLQGTASFMALSTRD